MNKLWHKFRVFVNGGYCEKHKQYFASPNFGVCARCQTELSYQLIRGETKLRELQAEIERNNRRRDMAEAVRANDLRTKELEKSLADLICTAELILKELGSFHGSGIELLKTTIYVRARNADKLLKDFDWNQFWKEGGVL